MLGKLLRTCGCGCPRKITESGDIWQKLKFGLVALKNAISCKLRTKNLARQPTLHITFNIKYAIHVEAGDSGIYGSCRMLATPKIHVIGSRRCSFRWISDQKLWLLTRRPGDMSSKLRNKCGYGSARKYKDNGGIGNSDSPGSEMEF